MGKKNKNKNEGQAGSGASGAQPPPQGQSQQSQGRQQQGQQQQQQRSQTQQPQPQAQQQQSQQQQSAQPQGRQQEQPQHSGKKQKQPQQQQQSGWGQSQQQQGKKQQKQQQQQPQGQPQRQTAQGQQQRQSQQSDWRQQPQEQSQGQPAQAQQQRQSQQSEWRQQPQGQSQGQPAQVQQQQGKKQQKQQHGQVQQQQQPQGQQSDWRQQPQGQPQRQPVHVQQQQQQQPQRAPQQLEGIPQGGWGRGRGQAAPVQQPGALGPSAAVPQQGSWGPSPSAQQQQAQQQGIPQGGWGRGQAAPVQQPGAWGPSAAVPQQGSWGPSPSAQQQQAQQQGIPQGGWGRGQAAPVQQPGAWGPSAAVPQQAQQHAPQQSARGPTGAQSRELSSSSSGSVPAQSSRSSTSVKQTSQGKSETPSPSYTPRQSSVSKSSSTTSFSSNVSQRSIPPGTLGIKGQCEANYLVLNLDRMPDTAYHYDVTITPDRPKKFFRRAFKQFVFQYLGGCAVAFDGVKSCYMVQMLPNPVYEGDVKIADTGSREIQFRVSIKPTDNAVIELKSLKTYHNERVFDKPMRALQCIEVVLANACHEKGIRVGRSFYTAPQKTVDLDEGYELYTGLYQAAILGDEPYLNVDISHKSFPMAFNLTDYLQKILGARLENGLEPRTFQNISSHLRGLNIRYTPPACFGSVPRSYKVNEVSRDSASVLSFTDDTGAKLTVLQYFASKGYRIRYPKLNCIVAGSAVKPNYLPIELCSIEPAQALKRKDGTKQVQKMIRFAATSTDERKRKIMEKLQYFMHNADELVRGFGINIGNGFITVPTRLLRPPSIEYRGNKCLEPRNGSWRNFEFLTTGATKAKDGHKWAIIYAPSRYLNHGTLQDFSNMLFNGAKRMGIILNAQREIKETRDIVKTLEEYKKNGYDLVFVVIPNFGTTYADIKQKAELVCGLLTQCIKEQTLCRRLDDQLIGNLLLKVNSKLNGSNHKIANRTNIILDNVMFMGADVTHPSPDQRQIPSVVGVAASHDLNGASYNMQYRLQESTKEEIVDMQSICRHHLRVYFQRQNCYPKSIIYYRDGVSDGQFQKVEVLELGAIRAVCKELRISPKITCVIVVKRHHTRFFPTTPTGDKFNNVLPGTVVDQKIVHPNETQFFMVSHQSIQGTAKPTRYNVIADDAKMTMDDLQKLTNNLCYMFPRCNRAVSYPAPAYLAHLVAARGRVYIEGPPLRRGLREEYNKRIINEQFMNTTPMFFV